MAQQGYPLAQGYPPQQQYPMQYQPQQNQQYYQQQQPQPQYQQHQQPYYPPPQGPPFQTPTTGQNSPQKAEDHVDEQTVRKPKYNDKIWALLFIANLLGFIAVSVISLRGLSVAMKGNTKGGTIKNNTVGFGASLNSLILLGIIIGFSFFGSVVYLLLARKFTKQFIYMTCILNIVLAIGTAIVYFAKAYYSAAIVFLIFGIFYAIAFWSWRSRIPFAVIMLNTVMSVSKRHGHVFLASGIGGLIATAFSVWFAVTLAAVYAKYTPDATTCKNVPGSDCSHSKVIGLVVYISFAAYWITEFIKNTVHVTVSGVFGSWYFCHNSPAGMPANITRNAARRALTFSFGSISFGSLIVALIATLRQLCTIAQQQNANDGNAFMAILFCCLRCLLDLVNWFIEFFNHYAYSYIALYGRAFIPSAKNTWTMFKDRGFDALINDSLIDPVLTAASIVIGYCCALLAFIYLEITRPSYNADRAYTPVVMVFGMLVGMQVCNVLMTPLKSGVATLFVAFAFDPQVLRDDFPELYEEVRRTYPQVQVGVGAQVV